MSCTIWDSLLMAQHHHLPRTKPGGAGIVHLIFTGQNEKKQPKRGKKSFEEWFLPMPEFPPATFSPFFCWGPMQREPFAPTRVAPGFNGPKWPCNLMLPFPWLSTIWPFQLESLSTTSSKPPKLVGFRYSSKNICPEIHLMKIRCEKSLENRIPCV